MVPSSPVVKKSSIGWRPDIDGLRALAVFAVFAFHAFPQLKFLKGGFVGVDVFFVISGFLISSIIYTQLAKGTFSFWDFYSRRIRRIYPVLLTVLIGCLGFGWFFLLSGEYRLLGKHIAAGAGFVSNFVLFFEKGYFDSAASTKPLLHLWSLGIEEQFYIFWPLILWLTWKFKKNAMFWVALVIAVISMAMNLYWFKSKPDMDFFLPHTRIWELLSGAMLAWGNLHWKEKAGDIGSRLGGGRMPDILSIGGFVLLGISIAFMSEQGFPGWQAVIPIAATVLIIMAGKDGILNRYILSNKVLVWFGLISYPMYLWHWPLLSMARIVRMSEPALWYRLIAFPICVILAWLTTKFIENPLRFGGKGKTKTVALFAVMVLMGLVGYFLFCKNGLPEQRWESSIAKSDTKNIRRNPVVPGSSSDRCDEQFPDWHAKTKMRCRFQKEAEQNTIALVGDSHAGSIFYGLTQYTNAKEGVMVFPAPCAAPYLDIMTGTKTDSDTRKNGWSMHRKAYEYIVSQPGIKTVILAHNPECSAKDVIDRQDMGMKNPEIAMENGMRRTFDMLAKAGKHVVVVLDNPKLPHHPKQTIPRPLFGQTWDGVFDRGFYDDFIPIKNYNKHINDLVKSYRNISVIDLSSLFCDELHCYAEKDGQLMFSDKNHLSEAGSLYVAPYILEKTRGRVSSQKFKKEM